MYSRSISEKKTISIAMIISTPEHGKQTLHLQAAVADKFIPYSCKELHGAVWASLSGFQLINWSQQLARECPGLDGPWLHVVQSGSHGCSFHFIHTPELLPHSSAQLLISGTIPALCEVRVGRFSLPCTFCWNQAFSVAITPIVGMQAKDIWEGSAKVAWPWEGERDWAGSFPEIPWCNK